MSRGIRGHAMHAGKVLCAQSRTPIEFQSVTSFCTAAVRTLAKFQIGSVNESEDRDV